MGIASVDTGGTFTDLVYFEEGSPVARLKVPSTPANPSRAVLDALAELRSRHPGAKIDEVRHGTTVATNALLERRGARVAFVATEGFSDLLYLRRQTRPDLYALHPQVSAPLVAEEDCLPYRERMGFRGTVLEAPEDPRAWVEMHRLRLEAVDAIAVCLLHSYANPSHERSLAEALRSEFPDKPLTVSSELVPLFREYERASTVAVNAYVAPLMDRYLGDLATGVAPAKLSVMGSAGGLRTVERVRREPVETVVSGPAGGVEGARLAGIRTGRRALLTLDMGGTSTDVSLILGGLQPDDEGRIADSPLRIPILPIETVGAGGGSIAYCDDGGVLRVGPESAGAVPGPACYGRGGTRPTVTDAHAVLGRLDNLLGGSMQLDLEAARSAVARLSDELGSSVEETARAILEVVEATMARACKRVSLDRGADPRSLTLVAFGGAGGLHACALADELGCSDVLFPAEPGVLSAEGIGSAPWIGTEIRSVLRDDWSASELTGWFEEARQGALDRLEGDLGRSADGASFEVVADMRYTGQTFTLPVSVSEPQQDLRASFEALHLERYGYSLGDGRRVELVAIRVFCTLPSGAQPAIAERESQAPVLGPGAIPSYGATLWLPHNWRAEATSSGDWLCKRVCAESSIGAGLALEVHRQRLASIAEEMGTALKKAAFSSNIKERRDYSCAIFDARGTMLAQAAHIPVHLGSQPLSVEAAIDSVDMSDGASTILNAPFAGGTHLPDVTVVTPVIPAGQSSPRFYVANRAHHADVGGISPGSMPTPRRADGSIQPLTIADEGHCIEPQKLDENARRAFADASRTPEERYGDLRAQEAANAVGTKRLLELVSALGEKVVADLDEALLDYGERRMRALLESIPDGIYHAWDFLDDDGLSEDPVRIAVTLKIDGSEAVVDFSASDDESDGAMNAVRAIAVSAVYYVFRCLGGDELPSNGGLMRPLKVVTRPGSIADAQSPRAVSAGNVETSQRLVDVLFAAVAKALPGSIPAASCGSMNNVLFGGTSSDGRAFVHYETLAGGAGAACDGSGADAIHTHMTNTLNTPIEEFERAFPVRIERYALRRDEEGGANSGEWPGGRGIERCYRFLVPTMVTLIGERRILPPPGRDGSAGATGKSVLEVDGQPARILAGKETIDLPENALLRIFTPSGGNAGRKSGS